MRVRGIYMLEEIKGRSVQYTLREDIYEGRHDVLEQNYTLFHKQKDKTMPKVTTFGSLCVFILSL